MIEFLVHLLLFLHNLLLILARLLLECYVMVIVGKGLIEGISRFTEYLSQQLVILHQIGGLEDTLPHLLQH